MFSVEFTLGRRSVSARSPEEVSGRFEFCDDVGLRSPSSAGCPGAEPMQRERDGQIRQFLFGRLLGGRWCRS